MVVDSSAFMAILQGEPEKDLFLTRIVEADARLMSAVSALEIGMLVVSRRGPSGQRDAESLLSTLGIEVSPFDAAQARLGIRAFERFGKGRHPAGLNFGDCAAYALSKASGEPLLFKGGDFARTDVIPALT